MPPGLPRGFGKIGKHMVAPVHDLFVLPVGEFHHFT
jgi:hypothetical protein